LKVFEKLRFLVSLTNNSNDYQQEQAAAADISCAEPGGDFRSFTTTIDAVPKSQTALQLHPGLALPVPMHCLRASGGTAFPQVERAPCGGLLVGRPELCKQIILAKLRELSLFPVVFPFSSAIKEVGKSRAESSLRAICRGRSQLYIRGYGQTVQRAKGEQPA